jgi:hypothetical protein
MARLLLTLISLFLIGLPGVLGQFQFFEHMFGGQQQQQQQPQNAGSDSAWYQQQYDGGTQKYPSVSMSRHELTFNSALRQIPLSSHPLLRALPSPLPLRIPECRRQGRIWRWEYGLCLQGRFQRGRSEAKDRVGAERVVMTDTRT